MISLISYRFLSDSVLEKKMDVEKINSFGIIQSKVVNEFVLNLGAIPN